MFFVFVHAFKCCTFAVMMSGVSVSYSVNRTALTLSHIISTERAINTCIQTKLIGSVYYAGHWFMLPWINSQTFVLLAIQPIES